MTYLNQQRTFWDRDLKHKSNAGQLGNLKNREKSVV
jgi:hypothetical protein